MGATDSEAFFAQHAHDRAKQAVITSKQRLADTGQNPRARRIGPQVDKEGRRTGPISTRSRQ